MGVVSLPKQLNLYRHHSQQTSGFKMMSPLIRIFHATTFSRAGYIEVSIAWLEAFNRLLIDGRLNASKEILFMIKDKIEHYLVRAKLTSSHFWRFVDIFREASRGRYHKYSQGFLSIARDLIIF